MATPQRKSDLPDPLTGNLEGTCAVCYRRAAVTRDKRFCKICLKHHINRQNYIAGAAVSEQRGRKQYRR